MLILIFLVGIPIVIADCASLRIPNVYTKFLAYVTGVAVVLEGVGRVESFTFYLVSLTLLYFLGVGMGDIKLLLIIGLVLNISSDINLFLIYSSLFLCASLHIVVRYVVSGRFQEKIPMAPSIFVALGAYLAASS